MNAMISEGMTIQERMERLLRALTAGNDPAWCRQEAGRLLADMEAGAASRAMAQQQAQDYTAARPGWDPDTGFSAQDTPRAMAPRRPRRRPASRAMAQQRA